MRRVWSVLRRKRRLRLNANSKGLMMMFESPNFHLRSTLILVTFFFSPQGFSREGCYVDPPESNSEDTVCRCNHLTHFSLSWLQLWPRGIFYSCCTLHFDHKCVGSINSLFNLTLRQLSSKDVTILEIITYVGLCLSIIGILSTITLYFFPHVSAISNQSAVYFLEQTMLNKTGVQQIVSNTYYRRLSTMIHFQSL